MALLLLGILYGAPKAALPLDFDLGAGDEEAKAYVSASGQIVYDRTRNEISAREDVVVDRGALHFTADAIHLDLSTRTGVAEGNVRMRSAGDEFSGSSLNFDLGEETGAFYDSTLFLEENHFYVQAGKIIKSGDETYFAEDVRVTTCDGDSPAWEVDGKELDITVGGYGKLKHGIFRVKQVPVFYVPYMIFPVKTDRQTGLLVPGFGFSDRKGVQVSQPLYWAINGSSDATLYVDYLSLRGQKLGSEYRYVLSEDDFGVVMFDFLDDEKVDDGSGTTSQDWGYTQDRYLRPNSDRYWFRMKHDQELGNASLYIDLDVVSDQDYLYEFRSGNSGFDDSNKQFLSVFNRELDDYTETVRRNRIGVSRQWPGYSLNAEARWWDNVIARTQADTDPTVQSLPVINFEGYRQSLAGTPLYAAFNTQAAAFYRQDGETGERIDLHPRLYLPYRLGRVLNIEPSLGGRETLWQIDRFDGDTEAAERNQHRELYDFKLNLSSEVYNVFAPRWGDIDALKHAATFQVEYDYIPDVDQADYPYFDGVDRIGGENLVTYSIVNTFTTRSGGEGARVYNQAMRLELYQTFDVGRHRDGDSEPFGPVEADLQLNLGRHSSLLADAAWSIYGDGFTSRNVSWRLSDDRGDMLSLQHRYAEALRETFKVTATLNLLDRLWLFPEYERNIKDDHLVTMSLEAIYRAQCWSLSALYREDWEDEGIDRQLGFTVTFHGLGGLGSSSDHSEGLPSWAQ